MEKLTIKVGDGVILRKGNNLKFILAKLGKKERMENFTFEVSELIGQPFGSAYQVNNKQLTKIDPKELEFDRESEEKQGENTEDKDNRILVDNPDSQKLSRDDIEKLKVEGAKGREVIEQIVENSATFQEKTVYSKAKYMKKKKRKHLAHFTTHYPTARLLCELFFSKAPGKILEIRHDTLAQILTFSNVRVGSNVLVVESCQGLITGSILERLGDCGQIVQVYPGGYPVRIILKQFNISDHEIEKRVWGFSLEKMGMLNKILSEVDKQTEGCGAEPIDMPVTKDNGSVAIETSSCDSEEESSKCIADKKVNNFDNLPDQEIEVRDTEDQNQLDTDLKFAGGGSNFTRTQRKEEELKAFSLLKDKNIDCLIIASRFHPKKILLSLIEYLRPSSPFVVYCQYKEPLMECYVDIRDLNLATNVHVSETWYRQIQVLPNRTHPDINMSGRSGYILRGIKLLDEDEIKGNNDQDEQTIKKQRTE